MTRSAPSPSAAALATLLLAASGALAQAPPPSRPDAEHSAHHDAGAAAAEPNAADKDQKKNGGDAESQATMDLEAIEAELDLLVTRMNESTGESRIDAIEKLLATLVRQRRAMCGAMQAGDGASSMKCCQEMQRSTAGESGTSSKPEVPRP